MAEGCSYDISSQVSSMIYGGSAGAPAKKEEEKYILTTVERIILGIVRNKKPGEVITFKEAIKRVNYWIMLDRICYGHTVACMLTETNILNSIGNLMDRGLLASDMELYIPQGK